MKEKKKQRRWLLCKNHMLFIRAKVSASVSVSVLARMIYFEWFPHQWSIRGDSVCVDATQVVGLSFHPQRSSKWAQLPHRESARSGVVDHLLQDLLPPARCAPSMQLRAWTLTLCNHSSGIWNISMRCENKPVFTVVASSASLRDVPFSSSQNSLFFSPVI